MYDAGNPKLVLCENVWVERGAGGRFRKEVTRVCIWPIQGFRSEVTRVCIWLIHVAVWQKPSQYCEVTVLQLK